MPYTYQTPQQIAQGTPAAAPPPSTFPTPQGLSSGAPGHIPADMTYWLGVKYAGQQVQGEYQKNIAEAGLRGAQAGTEQRISKYLDDPDHADFIHDVITRRGGMPWTQGRPGAPGAPAAPAPDETQGTPPAPGAPPPPRWFPNWFGGPTAPVAPTAPAPVIQPAPVAPLPLGAVPPPTPLQTPEQLTQSRQLRTRSLPQLQTPSLRRPSGSTQVSPPALDPNQPVLPIKPDLGLGFRKGTANVKAPPGKGGKAGKAGGMPKGLEAILPMLLAAQQGGQGAGGGPAPAPGGLPGGLPGGQPPPGAGGAGLRKGSANVKGKGGKAAGPGKAGGLEAILPALMAASQAGQMGGGAVGPQAATPAGPPSMAPGAAAPPGFAQGVVNVRRYADGTSDVSINDAMPPGFAYGAPDVQPNPGYPFGAGYLFGATAVPGRGSGTVDKVPAMLAPHEAVLNRAAADSLGRGRIAALNARGAKTMGLRRGAARV